MATERDEKMFLEEIRLSKKLGNHPNIVGIVGSIIVYQPYCLILEYVDGGDILDFLQKNREKNEAQISQEDQVFFAWQIANGMVNTSLFSFTVNFYIQTATIDDSAETITIFQDQYLV